MAGLTRGLMKTFTAEVQIPARRIVKFGSTDVLATLATASTDLSIGVTTELQAEIGEPVDVQMDMIAEVVLGGTVVRGAKLTSDATGRAVAAAPGVGVNAQIIGIALESGVIGDIRPALLSIGVLQG